MIAEAEFSTSRNPLGPILIILALVLAAGLFLAQASQHALRGHGQHAQSAIDCFDNGGHYLGQFKISRFDNRYVRACMDDWGRIGLDFMDETENGWERVTSYFKQRFEGDRQGFMRWIRNRATKYRGPIPW